MIPAELARALPKTHFWLRLANPLQMVPGDYAELVDGPVELARVGELGLHLRFLPPKGLEVAVELARTRDRAKLLQLAELVAIGNDRMSHALRWAELEQILRWAAIAGDLPHPGWPLVLLARAAPACDADGDYPMGVLER